MKQAAERSTYFPEEVFVHLWSDGRESVINIHEDVDERVDEGEERTVAA